MAFLRKLSTGARVLIHPCDHCGVDNAPWGFFKNGHLSRWYCTTHREIGERWLLAESIEHALVETSRQFAALSREAA